MRASSLSNKKVIELLNAHFVPVYVSNEDYRPGGPAPADERGHKDRIYREALAAKLSTGTVHAYVLTPDGRPIDSLHVANAAKPANTIAMLERAVQKLNVPAGKPLIKPTPGAAAPTAEKDALVLHLTARVLKGGGWGEFPAENWIVLGKDQWPKFLPSASPVGQSSSPVGQASVPAVGTSWEIDPRVAAVIMNHVYPATENNDISKNQIEHQELKATLLSIKDDNAHARLDGRLKMKHWFYHKDDGNTVDATLVGYLDFAVDRSKIISLRLVTEKASYNNGTFGVAVRSVP